MTESNHSKDAASSNGEQVIDEEQFEAMRELLEEDFAGLLQTYIIDSKQRIILMQAAQAADDNASGFEAAHALKGASANLGATQLIALSGQLQESCRAQQVGQQAALIKQISIALQQVEEAINQRLAQQSNRNSDYND